MRERERVRVKIEEKLKETKDETVIFRGKGGGETVLG